MSRAPRQHGMLLACCFLVAALCSRAIAQRDDSELDPARVAAVKAGMVVNFVRYTTWPDSSFDDSSAKAPIVITIVGECDIEDALPAAARGQSVGGRPIEVRRVRYPRTRRGRSEPPAEEMEAFHNELRESHVVYFGASEHDRYDETLLELDGENILTLSDIDGFAEGGGMLGLALRENRIAFDANEEAIRACEVRVSSQVLRLARIVRRATPDEPPAEGGTP